MNTQTFSFYFGVFYLILVSFVICFLVVVVVFVIVLGQKLSYLSTGSLNLMTVDSLRRENLNRKDQIKINIKGNYEQKCFMILQA